MIHLQGKHVVLKTIEREHCRDLWQRVQVDPGLPSEPIIAGLSVEGANTWFDQIQAQQGKTLEHLNV